MSHKNHDPGIKAASIHNRAAGPIFQELERAELGLFEALADADADAAEAEAEPVDEPACEDCLVLLTAEAPEEPEAEAEAEFEEPESELLLARISESVTEAELLAEF